MIRNSDVGPTIVGLLPMPRGLAGLVEWVAAMGVVARDLFRRNDAPHDELRLDDPSWTDAQLH